VSTSSSRNASSLESASHSSSRSSSPPLTELSKETKPGTSLQDFFKINEKSERNWHLSQKSEMLLFDDKHTSLDDALKQQQQSQQSAGETFIWRKKNQKIGLDKLDPEQMFLVNKLKQEETNV
jgi:uncharacterized protein YdcH (DUF465 family)